MPHGVCFAASLVFAGNLRLEAISGSMNSWLGCLRAVRLCMAWCGCSLSMARQCLAWEALLCVMLMQAETQCVLLVVGDMSLYSNAYTGADSVACIQLWSLHEQCRQLRGCGVVYLPHLLACALQYHYLNYGTAMVCAL
jgi:hypothetical protein